MDDIKIQSSKDKSPFTRKSSAGKGDAPRNISRQYWDNWDEIKWSDKKDKKSKKS